ASKVGLIVCINPMDGVPLVQLISHLLTVDGPVRPPDSFMAIVSNAPCQDLGAPVAEIAALIHCLTFPLALPPEKLPPKSPILSFINLTGLSLRYFSPLPAISFGILARPLSMPMSPITFLTSSFGFEAYSHTSLTLLNVALPASLIPLHALLNIPFAYFGICFVILAGNTCVPFGRLGYSVGVDADKYCFPFCKETSSLPALDPLPSPIMVCPPG